MTREETFEETPLGQACAEYESALKEAREIVNEPKRLGLVDGQHPASIVAQFSNDRTRASRRIVQSE